MNRTRVSWVRSANATSVLCRPPRPGSFQFLNSSKEPWCSGLSNSGWIFLNVFLFSCLRWKRKFRTCEANIVWCQYTKVEIKFALTVMPVGSASIWKALFCAQKWYYGQLLEISRCCWHWFEFQHRFKVSGQNCFEFRNRSWISWKRPSLVPAVYKRKPSCDKKNFIQKIWVLTFLQLFVLLRSEPRTRSGSG